MIFSLSIDFYFCSVQRKKASGCLQLVLTMNDLVLCVIYTVAVVIFVCVSELV